MVRLCRAREAAGYLELPRGTVSEIIKNAGAAFGEEGNILADLVLEKAEFIKDGRWKYPILSTGQLCDVFKSTLPPASFGEHAVLRSVMHTATRVVAVESNTVTAIRDQFAKATQEVATNATKTPAAKAAKAAKATKPRAEKTKLNVTSVRSTVKSPNRSKKPKPSPDDDRIEDVVCGPWEALETAIIGFVNHGSHGEDVSERRVCNGLPEQVILAWKTKVWHNNMDTKMIN